jgi:hypothetical protein
VLINARRAFVPPFLSSSYLIWAKIDNAKRAGMVAPVAKP